MRMDSSPLSPTPDSSCTVSWMSLFLAAMRDSIASRSDSRSSRKRRMSFCVSTFHMLVRAYAGEGHHVPDPFDGKLGVLQESRIVGEHEELGQVDGRPPAFESSDHSEVILVPVQVRDEDDSCLVVDGRGAERMPADRDCWLQDRLEPRHIAGV